VLVKCLCRCSPAKGFASLVLRASATASRASVLWALRSVPFGKYCRNSPLYFRSCRAARAVRVAEIDVQARVDLQPCMLRHLRPLIPGQRPSELLRQAGDRARDAVADCLSAMPGQRRPVLHASVYAVLRHPRQVQQHREPRRALHQRADRGTVQSQDEIPFPVAGTTRSATSAGRSLIMISGR